MMGTLVDKGRSLYNVGNAYLVRITAYLGPCQIYIVELLVKIINGLLQVTG